MAATNSARHNYYEEVRRHQRFNFSLHVVEGFFGWFGYSCFSPGLVLAVYVGLLTENRFLVVLPGMIQMLSWGLPQLMMAYFVQRFRTRKWLTVIAAAVDRVANTGIWLSIALLPVIGPKWSLVMLFACQIVAVPLIGLTHTAWQDLLGRLILPGYRGRFFGVSHSVGTMAAWLAAALVGWLLPSSEVKEQIGPVLYAAHYVYPLFIGVAVLWASTGLLTLTREAPYPTAGPARDFGDFWRRMYRRFREDEPLRQYIYARLIGSGAALFGLSLFADYARRDFGISPKFIAAALGTALYLPQMLFSPVAGWLGDRIGFRKLLVASAALGSGAICVGLSLPIWGDWVAAGFVLVVFAIGSSWAVGGVGHMNMVYQYGAVEERPIVMALTAGVPSLFFAAAIAAGGLNVRLLGVPFMLTVSLGYALAATFAYAFLVTEPPGETGPDAAPSEDA